MKSISLFHLLVLLLLNFVCVNSETEQNSIVRIYSNLAEIIRPIDKLPIEFSEEEWNAIVPDSINLIGKNVTITSQQITRKKKSLNGAQVFARLPVSLHKSTDTVLKVTVVDERRNLVKLQDDSIFNGEGMYFTVAPNDIFYLEEPSVDNAYYVNFTYTADDENIYLSYLQTNLQWKTQYQLFLDKDEAKLIPMANIRNNANPSLSIDQAELFSGDFNLQNYNQPIAKNAAYDLEPRAMSSSATVSAPRELSGVHLFSIDKPFTIDSQTNYLLPMPCPQINVERYHLITKVFSAYPSNGKAARAYRLQTDQYLSNGNCLVRENDRIAGETLLPNVAAKDKHEFSIGQDSEVSYSENVTLLAPNQPASAPSYNYDQISREYPYNIQVQVKNFKDRPIIFEYKQQFFAGTGIELKSSTNNICTRDNTIVKCNAPVNANDEFIFSYEIRHF